MLCFGTCFENTLAQRRNKMTHTIFNQTVNLKSTGCKGPAEIIALSENCMPKEVSLSRFKFQYPNQSQRTGKINSMFYHQNLSPMFNQLSNPMSYQPVNPMFNQVKSNSVKNYAIIVPCYNEATRFPYQAFLTFAKKHPEVLLCFVNDGSGDKTLPMLRGIQYECPGNVCVYTLKQNSGKSEAVRQGMLYMQMKFNVELLGFLDADLATTADEWLQMAKYKEQYPQYGVVAGSRIQRLGASIKRDDNRSLFSIVIKKIIRYILKTPFQDTQCGAKIFHRNLIPFLFSKPFLTPWLFDVEIFLRLQKKFGKTTLHKGVLEYPLMQWTEIGDSRLKMKHAVKIPFQLARLYYEYHIQSKFNKQSKPIFQLSKQATIV
jgi:dolichyl-phosphate beta-glucosyltransferase